MSEEIKKKKSEIIKEKVKNSAKVVNLELKKSLNTAVVGAFAFLIALVWKDVITGYVDSISKASPIQGTLFSAFFTTIICVFGIILVTKVTRVKEEKT